MLGSATKSLPVPLQIIHWVIIVNFALQIFYGAYMTFFVITTGKVGPLADAAKTIPFELMMTRRLYASETWIAITGLALYFAITEILPRQLNARWARSD